MWVNEGLSTPNSAAMLYPRRFDVAKRTFKSRPEKLTLIVLMSLNEVL
jgi:hypothetical protein